MGSHPNVGHGYWRAPAFQIVPNGAKYLRCLTVGIRNSDSWLPQELIEFFTILDRPISSGKAEKQLSEDENGHIYPFRSGDNVQHSCITDLESGIGTRIQKNGSQTLSSQSRGSIISSSSILFWKAVASPSDQVPNRSRKSDLWSGSCSFSNPRELRSNFFTKRFIDIPSRRACSSSLRERISSNLCIVMDFMVQ
jgi:hypothetical protein